MGQDPQQLHRLTGYCAGAQQRLQFLRAGDHQLAGVPMVLGIQGAEVDVGAGVVTQTAIRPRNTRCRLSSLVDAPCFGVIQSWARCSRSASRRALC